MSHSVGKTIAELRKEKGWTQIELAEKLQVSDKAISKWEKDESFPSIDFFPKLSNLFDVSIDFLITGNEFKKTNASKHMPGYDKNEIERCFLVNGVVNIQKLLYTDDFEFIKFVLENYPIHKIEQIIKIMYNKRALFQFAVDNEHHGLADAIINDQLEERKMSVHGSFAKPQALRHKPSTYISKLEWEILNNYWYRNVSC